MTSQSKLEQIRILIQKAADNRTPIEEARTTALLACRLIVKHKLLFSPDELSYREDESESPSQPEVVPFPDDIPDFSHINFSPVGELFRSTNAIARGICVSCQQPFDKGEPIAVPAGRSRNYDMLPKVHPRCRRYFVNPGG